MSFVVAIQLLQNVVGEPPRGTHDWRMFITPNGQFLTQAIANSCDDLTLLLLLSLAETEALLSQSGFQVGPREDWRGMGPMAISSWSTVLLKHRSRLTGVVIGETGDLSIGYMGWARRI